MAATKNDYFAVDAQLGKLWDALSETHDGHDRAKKLIRAAELEDELSATHREAFGPDPIECENGRDLAESLTSSSLLLNLLADVEFVACGCLTSRAAVGTRLESCAGPVLDRMAATADIAARSVLLLDLYEAVEPHVGGQAAETLACLPYRPGFRGWDDNLYLPNSFPKLVRTLWRTWRESR